MKKTISLLLILFLSFNLFAQNPFVKKIENKGDNDFIKLINQSKIYFGDSNVDILDQYIDGTIKGQDSLVFNYRNIKRLNSDECDYCVRVALSDNNCLLGVKSYINSPDEKREYKFLNYEISQNKNLFITYENYKFKNFSFFYDDERIYVRGYDGDNFIEFYGIISDCWNYDKPAPIIKDSLFINFDYTSYIKEYVQTKMNKWQQKGEFEKLSNYSLRVTHEKIIAQTKIYQQKAIDNLETYFPIFSFLEETFKLNAYDSENETYAINSKYLDGDIILKVPIKDASFFKDLFVINKYGKFKFGTNDLKFLFTENKVILTSINFYAPFYNPKSNKREKLSFDYNINDKLNYDNIVIDYNFDKIDLNVAQSTTNIPVAIIEDKTISVGKSSVDVNIPENTKVANRYALIIGNEDYQSFQRSLNSEQNVAFAVNDATIFRDYAVKTLGVEQENITFLTNATAGQMSQQIDKVCKMLSKLGNKAELIVYYAGHGYPDENTKVPYLIPVDVSSSNLDMAIKLNNLYKNLSATNAKRIIVFLDACFTGGGRSSGLLASRGIKVIPKEDALNGNIVVVTASSGLQSALPYPNEKHGMFSYYLLKKIQDSKGNITLAELFSYLKENVSLQSLKINNKEQDPTINFSSIIEKEYESWNFKN